MKKSLALMLALIMVLCMIPTTALAADMSWTWTVTIFGGNYYRADGTQTSTNRYTINQHLNNSVDHEIGYKFEWNASAGGSNYNGGWQLCLTVDGKIVERSTAYIYERNMSTASATWTAPASSHTGNSSHPFTLYLSDYPERFQKITLTYNANGGANPPASETKQVEKGQSATFKVSAIEPTKENYTFKGWSTAENATTAEYKGGDSITIRQNTILYAVWANHEHKDENGDGYCDTDHECMHEKDQDGYCIVDGCTHPHEGDGACCPKKSDNKPERPEPENTSKPFIELTGEKAVKVHCTNDKANHDDKIYGLMHDGYTVGEVQGDKENGYTCDITVNPDKYVDQYNLDIEGGHKLDPESQPGKINLKWDGSKWEVVSDVPVVFNVKCGTQEPPTDTPKLPAADVIPKIVGKDAVKVLCTTNAKHAAMRCDLLENSFDIGVVTKEETSGEYFCNITVHADKYVKKYNEYLKGHTLETEGQTGTITLNWDAAGRQWKYTENKLPVTFTVMCETVPEETYYIVTYTDGVGGAAFANQVKRVKSGDPTPAFTGTPSRSGYTFTGWTPAVTDTVTDNVTYTAQWKNNDNHTPGGGNGGHSHYYPTTPVPVIVIPPKTGDMTIWQSILHFLGIR